MSVVVCTYFGAFPPWTKLILFFCLRWAFADKNAKLWVSRREFCNKLPRIRMNMPVTSKSFAWWIPGNCFNQHVSEQYVQLCRNLQRTRIKIQVNFWLRRRDVTLLIGWRHGQFFPLLLLSKNLLFLITVVCSQSFALSPANDSKTSWSLKRFVEKTETSS